MSYLADQLKEKGNTAFRNGEFAEAEDYYTQALQKYSGNQFIFTNRANVRLKLLKWEDAANDCYRSIEISGPQGQNHKAWYFLAQAQLSLHRPNEALASALSAYGQVRDPPSISAKIPPSDLEIFSQFVLKCKKAKFSARERDRLARKGDLRGELEGMIEAGKRAELDALAAQLAREEVGYVEAVERCQEVTDAADTKIADLRAVFAAAAGGSAGGDPPREVPDHLVDRITFEPMHDPVITKNGHSYERATLYEHLKRSPTDPMTREPLTIGELRKNFGLRAACDAFWESGAGEWIGDW